MKPPKNKDMSEKNMTDMVRLAPSMLLRSRFTKAVDTRKADNRTCGCMGRGRETPGGKA